MKTIVRMGIEQKRQDSSRDIKCVLEEMCVYELLFYLSRWKSCVDTFFFFWTFFSSKKRLGIIVFLYLSLYSPPAPPTYKILIIIGILKTKAETARRLSQENTIEEKQGLTKKYFWPIWASEMCHTAKFLRIVNECIIYFSSISISSIVRFINHKSWSTITFFALLKRSSFRCFCFDKRKRTANWMILYGMYTFLTSLPVQTNYRNSYLCRQSHITFISKH